MFPGQGCAARVEHRRPEHLLLREQRTFLSGNNVADYQVTRKGSRGLNKVCRICEICGHVNKTRLKKMSLLKIENFDFEDRNGMSERTGAMTRNGTRVEKNEKHF